MAAVAAPLVSFATACASAIVETVGVEGADADGEAAPLLPFALNVPRRERDRVRKPVRLEVLLRFLRCPRTGAPGEMGVPGDVGDVGNDSGSRSSSVRVSDARLVRESAAPRAAPSGPMMLSGRELAEMGSTTPDLARPMRENLGAL